MPAGGASINAENSPHTLTALRQSRDDHRRRFDPPAATSSADRNALREARLDRIEHGKNIVWRNSLRWTQLANILLTIASALFIIWQDWAYWAAALAATGAGTGMWLFARRMAPREERLRRLLVSLARRRRACVVCGYLIRDLASCTCPECGTAFDPQDDRHILTQQTLQLLSSRGRQVAAVAIVFVLFSMTELARPGAGWFVHLGLAIGLGVAFHCLRVRWGRQDRAAEPPGGSGDASCCPACRAGVPADTATPPEACPHCARRLTYADVFVRPSVKRLGDQRARRLFDRLLMVRYTFLVALFIGLVGLIEAGGVIGRIPILGFGGPALMLKCAFPVLLWVVTLAATFRFLARRLRRRLKLLFAQIAPECLACGAALAEQPVGLPCPSCGRNIRPWHVRG